MSTSFELAVDAFLNQHRTSTFTGRFLNRVWKAFMAYSMCLVVETFRKKNCTVTPQNHVPAFIFKCFPAGDPDNYSYFLVQKNDETYEVRLSVYCQNLRFNGLRLNMDMVVIRPNSINPENVVDSETDLVTFAECKNLRGFPELVATLEGMTLELQSPRLWRNTASQYRIPCCLLLSGSGFSIREYLRRRNRALRVFDMLQPGSSAVQQFIQTWF